MSVLEYRARGEDGSLHTGRATQAQLTTLRAGLRNRGLFLVEVRKVRARPFVRRRVSRRELALMAYHLQTVVRAGVPLIAGLTDLAEQNDDSYLGTVIDDMIDAVESGSSLSQAFARHPKVFPQEFVQMTMAGELSGKLDDSFDRLVHLLEWQEELRGQVRQLVSYPIVVLTALFGLLVLLLTFVIPRFGGILESLDVELPVPTRVLMALSAFCLDSWEWILGFSIVIAAGAFLILRAEHMKVAVDRWSLRIPLYGNLRLHLISSQISHFLGTFIAAGVPMGQGLDLIVSLSGNHYARQIMGRIRERVFEGDPLSRAFRESGLFPVLVLRMIAIGEESGTLPDALHKVGEYYDKEIPRRVKTIMDVAAPTLTVVLAGILCFVVLAVLLPIYKMYGALT